MWLTDRESGRQLWAERYERPFRDVLVVQEEIISHILQVLPVQITAAERQRLSRRYTRNLEAYDYFLRAKAAFLMREPAENQAAQRMYRKAIELDPAFARAYAYLGAVYTHMGRPVDAIPMLRMAMRLNPDAGFIYFVVLGRAYLFLGDIEQAMINLREALARNPTDLEARVFMAATLVAAGDLSAASWEAVEVRTLKPGFVARQWLRTHPMTNADQKQRLINLLAQVEL